MLKALSAYLPEAQGERYRNTDGVYLKLMNLRAVRMSDRCQPLGRHVAVSERLECRTLLIEVESMDEATRQRLYNEDHALCLAWFEEHSGTTTTWPKPIRDDVVLVTQFKGIFKPKWMPYVLSIRSSPKGPYADSPVTYNDDRSWSFSMRERKTRDAAGIPCSPIGHSGHAWKNEYQSVSFIRKASVHHTAFSG